MNKTKKQFNSPTQGKMELPQVISEIVKYIDREPKRSYELVIGTDSNGSKEANFVSAIIVHRIGQGGRYFWKKWDKKLVHSLRDKIYQEVNFSLDLAQQVIGKLQEELKKNGLPQYGLDIHIDVGENGDTREMIKEVVGMVKGNGFRARYKPESYGASIVADKHT
jgi:hypothetical protein